MNLKVILLVLLVQLSLSQKVNLQIYSESLCPDCIEFYTKSFKNAVQTPDFDKICEFQIYAYGNASQKQNGDVWEFTCQHGPNECYGNVIETCVEHYYPQTVVGDFVVCLSQKSFRELFKPNFNEIGPYCADKIGIDWDKIYDCANGNEGNNLEHEVANETDSLNPPKNYVPWINVDGVHDVEKENQILDNMLKFACENYKGEESIEGCQQFNGKQKQYKLQEEMLKNFNIKKLSQKPKQCQSQPLLKKFLRK